MNRWLKISFLVFLLTIPFVSRAQADEVYCSVNDGMKADGKTILEHGGTKHEFCCAGCLEKFKANPENFALQIQQPVPASSADAEAACSDVCSK